MGTSFGLQEFTAVSMIRWLPLVALKQPWMTPEGSGMVALPNSDMIASKPEIVARQAARATADTFDGFDIFLVSILIQELPESQP
jgi:hypothetical protein